MHHCKLSPVSSHPTFWQKKNKSNKNKGEHCQVYSWRFFRGASRQRHQKRRPLSSGSKASLDWGGVLLRKGIHQSWPLLEYNDGCRRQTSNKGASKSLRDIQDLPATGSHLRKRVQMKGPGVDAGTLALEETLPLVPGRELALVS